MSVQAQETDWEAHDAYMGEYPALPAQWGLRSEGGVVTPAKHGEEQARSWLTYSFPGFIGPVNERLVTRIGDGEWVDAR